MKKEDIKVGLKVNAYYGNGKFCGVRQITKVSEKSVWTDGYRRESFNTFLECFKTGIYRVES